MKLFVGDQEVRGVILAAGRGSRMGSLTENLPKCLVEVGGRSLLAWQLTALRKAGLRSIALVRGYGRHRLKRAGLSFFENSEWASTNSLYSLLQASSWLEESSCVVSYSDIAYHPDIIKALLEHDGDLVIPYDILWRELWEQRFLHPEADAETFRVNDGWLTEIGTRGGPLEAIQGQFMGLVKISPRGWLQVRQWAATLAPEELRSMDTTGALSRLLSRRVSIAALPVPGRWCEIDSEADLSLCRQKFAEEKGWSHDWRF